VTGGESHANLTVELLLTDARLDLVAERIDLAIRLGELEDSTLIIKRLMPTKYAVYGSPDYLGQHSEITQPQDITEHNCLLFPLAGFRSCWIFRDSEGIRSAISVQGRTVISNAIALQECAIAGMGLALLPDWLIKQDLVTGRLVRVLPNYRVTATDFETSAWLVYPSRSYVPLKVKVLIDFLKGHLAS